MSGIPIKILVQVGDNEPIVIGEGELTGQTRRERNQEIAAILRGGAECVERLVPDVVD